MNLTLDLNLQLQLKRDLTRAEILVANHAIILLNLLPEAKVKVQVDLIVLVLLEALVPNHQVADLIAPPGVVRQNQVQEAQVEVLLQEAGVKDKQEGWLSHVNNNESKYIGE